MINFFKILIEKKVLLKQKKDKWGKKLKIQKYANKQKKNKLFVIKS